MGNFLRHSYHSISDEIVWNTVKDDLPVLKRILERALGPSGPSSPSGPPDSRSAREILAPRALLSQVALTEPGRLCDSATHPPRPRPLAARIPSRLRSHTGLDCPKAPPPLG
jgi:hypothetical protein